MDSHNSDASGVQMAQSDDSIKKEVDGMWMDLKSRKESMLDEIQTSKSLGTLLERVQEESEKRGRLRRRKFQSFCSEMSKVLQAFTGIADIVKGVDPRLGAVLYGGLATVVMVAYKKQALEDQITNGLERINGWLQDLTDYQSIWKQDPGGLQSLALDVSRRMKRYIDGVLDYYSEGVLARSWHAIKTPKHIAETELAELDNGIRRFINETEKLHQKTTIMTAKRAEKLEQVVVEQTERHDRDNLSFFCSRLCCPDIINPKQHVLRLRETQGRLALQRGELLPNPYDPPAVKRAHSDIDDRLQDCLAFQEWAKNKRGCLVLLRALNTAHPIDANDPLWLSPALALFAEQKGTEQSNRVIYHAVTNVEELITTTTAVIIYSILSWDVSFLRDYQQMTKNRLDSQSSHDDALKTQLDLMKDLLSKWTSEHPSNTVYVILDRVEMYVRVSGRWSKDEQSRLRQDAKALIRVLVEAVKICQGVVKVCLLVNDAFWDMIHESISDVSEDYFFVSKQLLQ